MERIVIEVSKTAAKKWRAATEKEKRKIASALQQVMKDGNTSKVNEPPPGYARPTEKELKKQRKRILKRLPKHMKFLDEMSDKAAARGLTPEILEDLLKKND